MLNRLGYVAAAMLIPAAAAAGIKDEIPAAYEELRTCVTDPGRLGYGSRKECESGVASKYSISPEQKKEAYRDICWDLRDKDNTSSTEEKDRNLLGCLGDIKSAEEAEAVRRLPEGRESCSGFGDEWKNIFDTLDRLQGEGRIIGWWCDEATVVEPYATRGGKFDPNQKEGVVPAVVARRYPTGDKKPDVLVCPQGSVVCQSVENSYRGSVVFLPQINFPPAQPQSSDSVSTDYEGPIVQEETGFWKGFGRGLRGALGFGKGKKPEDPLEMATGLVYAPEGGYATRMGERKTAKEVIAEGIENARRGGMSE